MIGKRAHYVGFSRTEVYLTKRRLWNCENTDLRAPRATALVDKLKISNSEVQQWKRYRKIQQKISKSHQTPTLNEGTLHYGYIERKNERLGDAQITVTGDCNHWAPWSQMTGVSYFFFMQLFAFFLPATDRRRGDCFPSTEPLNNSWQHTGNNYFSPRKRAHYTRNMRLKWIIW